MAVDTKFVLGYGSYAKIEFTSFAKGTQPSTLFALTNGSIQKSVNVGFVSSFHIPYDSTAKRSMMRLNEGIYTFSGNITFQLTTDIATKIISEEFLMQRNQMFNLSVYDGQYQVYLPQCVWQNFSLTGNPNGAIECSLSFQSLNNHQDNISVKTLNSINVGNFIDKLQPYWKYGYSDGDKQIVQNFTLTFSRSVQPIFLNNSLKMPSYLRVGLTQAELQITCLQKWFALSQIILGATKITFTGDYNATQNWSFSGMQGEGMKTWTIKGSNAVDDSCFIIGDEQDDQ